MLSRLSLSAGHVILRAMSTEDRAFEIIESRADAKNPVPPVSRKKDGFSRQDVVNAFANAFTMIGGVQRLALWANQNPDKFFPLYAKLMPSTSINIGDNASVQIVHAIAPTALDDHDSAAETGSLYADVREADPESR